MWICVNNNRSKSLNVSKCFLVLSVGLYQIVASIRMYGGILTFILRTLEVNAVRRCTVRVYNIHLLWYTFSLYNLLAGVFLDCLHLSLLPINLVIYGVRVYNQGGNWQAIKVVQVFNEKFTSVCVAYLKSVWRHFSCSQ